MATPWTLRTTVAFELAGAGISAVDAGAAGGGGDGGGGDGGGGGTYCFDVAASRSLFAVSASNGAVKLYQHGARGVALVQRLRGHQGRVNDLAFDARNAELLWTAAADGTVRAWDARAGAAAQTFEDRERARDEILSFSVSADGTVVAAGTTANEKSHEAAIKFWDIRTQRLLTRFLDVHSDDVTKIRFHPTQPQLLASCAEDGLINIYNLTPTLDEEESMESVLNVGQTAEKIGFFGPAGEHFYCTTHIQTFSVWDPLKAVLLRDFGDVRALGSEMHPVDYAIDCHYNVGADQLVLFAGAYDGTFHAFNVTADAVHRGLTFTGGHTDTVRCVTWNPELGQILTGGEDGQVCYWTRDGMETDDGGPAVGPERSAVPVAAASRAAPGGGGGSGSGARSTAPDASGHGRSRRGYSPY